MNAEGIPVWSAIIPLKPPGQRKTRLAGRLTTRQRDRLAAEMFQHVATILRMVSVIEEISLLSVCPLPGWPATWIRDQCRGLNTELRDAANTRPDQNLLVILADLPLLAKADILDLIGDDQTGSSIASDRHGTGTNALALRNEPRFGFAFGDRSFSHHTALAQHPLRVVERVGLALDVDTPEDLDLALEHLPAWFISR